jgi:Ulp1 family protease
MDADEVEHLRKVYNEEHKSEKPIPSGPIVKVWNAIKERLHEKCSAGTAECVVAHMLKKQKAPEEWVSNPEEWLSSIDIEKVESEFMHVFAKYKFLGCIPIDFDKKSQTGKCIVDSLCSIRIRDLYDKGARRIGIVFNTDVSTGPGQHWIALFADLNPKYENARITYFDSYSKAPEPEIQRLMHRWKEQWDSTKIHSKPTELTYNKTLHQHENSECGMYCIYFHWCCLVGVPMEKRVPDEVVRSFRGVLYSIGKK